MESNKGETIEVARDKLEINFWEVKEKSPNVKLDNVKERSQPRLKRQNCFSVYTFVGKLIAKIYTGYSDKVQSIVILREFLKDVAVINSAPTTLLNNKEIPVVDIKESFIHLEYKN